MVHSASSCENCGIALEGRYCYSCGQRQIKDHDWSLGHFLHELTHEIIHVDSNIFRSLKLLLFRPGELTARYLAGHRVSYVSPIRLYLAVTAVFFFFGSIADFTVEGLTRFGSVTGVVEGLQQEARSTGRPYDVLLGHFNEAFHRTFSVLIALGVLVFGLALYALYRSRDRWFSRHLVFALHCYSYIFAVVLFWRIAVHFLVAAGLVAIGKGRSVTDGLVALFLYSYLFLALRRVYPESWWRRTWRWLVLLIVQFILYGLSLLGAILITAKLLI